MLPKVFTKRVIVVLLTGGVGARAQSVVDADERTLISAPEWDYGLLTGIPQPGGGPPIDARYLWQITEGDVIIVRNTNQPRPRLVIFETRVDGKYAWRNSGKYLSSHPGRGADGPDISMFKSR